MNHVAVMNKSWGLIPKILSGEKTIESRWYQTKRAPWDNIRPGDVAFFKNVGEPVTAKAEVLRVLQWTLSNISDVERIVQKYGKHICLVNSDPSTWKTLPKYCVLVFLAHPALIDPPFHINKTGFGIGSAWLVVDDVENIRVSPAKVESSMFSMPKE